MQYCSRHFEFFTLCAAVSVVSIAMLAYSCLRSKYCDVYPAVATQLQIQWKKKLKNFITAVFPACPTLKVSISLIALPVIVAYTETVVLAPHKSKWFVSLVVHWPALIFKGHPLVLMLKGFRLCSSDHLVLTDTEVLYPNYWHCNVSGQRLTISTNWDTVLNFHGTVLVVQPRATGKCHLNLTPPTLGLNLKVCKISFSNFNFQLSGVRQTREVSPDTSCNVVLCSGRSRSAPPPDPTLQRNCQPVAQETCCYWGKATTLVANRYFCFCKTTDIKWKPAIRKYSDLSKRPNCFLHLFVLTYVSSPHLAIAVYLMLLGLLAVVE